MNKMFAKKGDIAYFIDSEGKEYMIINSPIYKSEAIYCRDGKMQYRRIKQVNGYIIKFNTNGVSGFCLFKGDVCFEDNIWSLEQIIEIAKNY